MSLTKDGFYKSFSGAIGNNSYLLEAGGGHIAWGNGASQIPYSNGTVNTNLNADMLDGVHSTGFFRYEGWWSSGSGQSVDNSEGMNFVYSDHGSPSEWGVLSTFSYQRGSNYKMQLFSNGYTDGYTYYRNKSSDRGGWGPWIRLLDSVNWKSIMGLSSAVGSPSVPIYWTGSAFATCIVSFGNQSYGEHNANNINDNGIKYYNANGPSTSLGASTGDGALYSQAYSTSWVGQIAQDYRNGGLYVRGKNNGTWQSWYRVWDNRTTYVSGSKGYIGGTEITYVNNAGNADTIDGYHAGVQNGQVSIFVPWPSIATMQSEGLLTTDYGTSGYGHPDEVYLQAICKWAIAHYVNLGDVTLIGAIAPNSSGTIIMHLYSSSGKDSTTLLPRYCASTYQNLSGYIYEFGCVNYVWYYRRLSAGNADTLDGLHYGSFLRKDTNDSSSYQYLFSKTNDHAIQIGTIRGYTVGSQTGNYLHIYERVHIGSPSGWGSRNAPSYGLSTYGGAWLATDTGSVGIGTTSPSYKLHVAGSTYITDYLGVGTIPDSTYGRLVFPENNIAIGFRKNGSYKTSVQYMTVGNEALVFSTQQAVTSFIFKCGHAASNGSDWQSGVIGTPSVQIKQQSLYVNGYIANGSSPSYNLYVGGTAYISGQHYAAGYHHNSVDSDNYVLLAGGGYEAKSNYYRNLGGGNYITITVDGDANTYYPVVIGSPSDYYPYQFVNITRHYSETAPDTWNTSTHKGGLSMAIFWNGSSYWDGNASGSEAFVVRLYQSYCTMVGGVDNCVGGKVVWLRGGGANYHIFSMNGRSQSATVYLSTYTDGASRSFAPRTSPVTPTVQWPGDIQNGSGYLRDRSNSTAIYANYGAAGLGLGSITWLTCWNGYELRAISKAECGGLTNVYQHTVNNVDYPLVWSDQNNTSAVQANQLHKSYADLVYNPYYKIIKTAGGYIMGNASGYFIYRDFLGGSNLEAGFYFHSSGRESVVFANQYAHTGWIFVNGIKPSNRTQWNALGVTPAVQIHHNALYINRAVRDADTSDYNLFVNGTGYFTNRVYCDEWIQFNNYTGIYSPNNSAHFYPNNSTSYGQWLMQGARGGYSGIQFGANTGYMTIMDNQEDKGLYEQDWDWILYFNRRNKKLSFRTSSDLGADNNFNGSLTAWNYRIYGSAQAFNCNDVTCTGLWYYTSNGPSTTTLDVCNGGIAMTTGDASLYSQAYSTSWVSQIAQDYRNGRLFVRSRNNGTWMPWLNVINNKSHYSTQGSNAYYKISINSYTSWMLSFIIRVYQSYTHYDICVSGYNYGSNHWYSPNARMITSTTTSITVYFGYDSDYHLWVAISGASYTGIDIVECTNGYTQTNLTLQELFTITGVSSIPATQQTSVTAYTPWSMQNRPYWANVQVSDTSSTSTWPTFGSAYSNDWWRSNGNSGWYSQSWGGGIWMYESSWICTYGSKNFYVEGGNFAVSGNAGIGRTSMSYRLDVQGDSYTRGWARADSGFYCEGNGVHFTHQGSVGEIDVQSNNEFLWGSFNSTLYFNYRGVSRGTTVTNYIWNAGSSSTYAQHTLGNLYVKGVIYLTSHQGSWVSGMTSNPSIWYNNGNNIDGSSYWAFWAMKDSGGNVVNWGGLGNMLGFHGYKAGRTDNSYDWCWRVNASNGYWEMLRAYGVWHPSYQSSNYFFTTDGGVKYWPDLYDNRYYRQYYTSNPDPITGLWNGYGVCMTTQGSVPGGGSWWHIFSAGWSGSNDWISQLALPTESLDRGVWFRYRQSSSTSSWRRLHDYGHTYTTNGKGVIGDNYVTTLPISGYSTDGLSFYQTSSAFDESDAYFTNWAHYIISNHGNGSSYYHYTIALPFWSYPYYKRQTGSTGSHTKWYYFLTEENVSSKLYWANLSIQTSGNAYTTPSFAAIRMYGASSAGNHYITGSAGRIYFGGNFHIDSLGSNTTYINHYTSNNVYIVTGGGSVGIGNASPSYKLHVSGDIYANGGWLRVSGNQGLYFESYGGGWYMQDSSWIRNYNSKYVYINSSLQSVEVWCGNGTGHGSGYTLYVNGNAYIVNNLYASGGKFYVNNNGSYHTSDIRRKYDIRNILDEDINKLFETENGFIRHFKWKESNVDCYGFIAQELLEYCPEAVDLDINTNYYSVNYNIAFSKIIGAMFKKIKELENKLNNK